MHNSDKCGVEVTGPHRSKDFIEISAVNNDELFVINFNYLFLLLQQTCFKDLITISERLRNYVRVVQPML